MSQCLSFLYGPGTFQAAASVMDFEVSEFLFKSFKRGVSSLSYSPWAPRDGSPADFQSQFLWALSFPVQVPQAGKPDVGPGPLLLRGTSAVVISLLFVGCPTGVGRGALVLNRAGLYASYLSQCGLFLIPLVTENLSCCSSGQFSEAAALYVVVVLVCPWEEMSTGSAYSTSLI